MLDFLNMIVCFFLGSVYISLGEFGHKLIGIVLIFMSIFNAVRFFA